MKKLAAVGALSLIAACVYAQGLSPANQTKDDWEEINFEFNSSILSDGYPSLLRLADLLQQHKDYKVKVTGNTDNVGGARYNDKLAMARAEAVKAFLVKYGADPGQIATSGQGKASPEVDNRTKEGRFMNRRVVLAVTDGNGKLVKEGGISDVIPAFINDIKDMLQKQADCCAQILKRLDKLDDILAAVKALEGENAQLKADDTDLRNQLNALKDQVAGLPKPLSAQETTNIAHNEAQGAANEALEKAKAANKKFTNIGLDIGPTFGPSRTGNFTVNGHGRFFSPFGGDGTQAVQAQGEYMYYPGHQEGQFDIGLVKRWNNLQAGAFASFKYINFNNYQNGGGLGQADFLLDYVFSRGRIGIFGTQGFKNVAVLNSSLLAPGTYLQTIARVANQYGASGLVGVWGDAYIEGNVAYVKRHFTGHAVPGAELKLTQPLSPHVAFTAEADYNQTLVDSHNSGQLAFGFEVGNYIHPKDYGKTTSPVPMDVPRIRYDIGTRRVGGTPPVADAGPPQTNVAPGTVTLNGSGSYDPLGEALTYQWQQISGPTVALANGNTSIATFTGVAGAAYAFRLTVTNTDNLRASASTTVAMSAPAAANAPTINLFTAAPAAITSGQSSTLTWQTTGATSVTISPNVGSVTPNSGSVAVTPTATTTYTLTATNANGSVNQAVTITVGAGTAPGLPQIVRFEANPLSIAPGGTSTLSWATNNATTVTINNGIGSVNVNGSVPVTPTATTTYTLTATNAAGQSVTAPITVTVAGNAVPQVVTFVATPSTISPGQQTKLCWQVTNAQSIAITPGVGTNLNANDCATVTPSTTTVYTLTATNGAGQIQANATVVVGQVQILSFSANPTFSTNSGSPVVLSWTTANATQVVLIGGDLGPQTLQPNGSFTINPTSNETYTLTAYGPGGQTVSTTISVFVR